MEIKIEIYKKLINEFTIFRMEEEINYISELKRKYEDKINGKKLNLNFIYKKKCENLQKEYDYKKDIYETFVQGVNEKRINIEEFDEILNDAFVDDSLKVKRYCFFLQCYFLNLFNNSFYEERKRLTSLKEIAKELKLDDSILDFIPKSIKKDAKVIEPRNFMNILLNSKMIFDIETFYPFANDLNKEEINFDASILTKTILEKELKFSLPDDKKIIDISINNLKKYLFIFLLINDYLSVYSIKEESTSKTYVASFLKMKNEFEHLVLEKQVKSIDKEEKISLLNRIIEEIGTN